MRFFRKKEENSKAKEKAKADFEKCATLNSSHLSNVFQTRIALRSRTHLDKAFLLGARLELKYQADVTAAIKAGNPIPERQTQDGYQVLKTSNGSIISYVDPELVQKMSDLGGKYQRADLNVAQVFQEANDIAKQLLVLLKADSQIQLLGLLRNEDSATDVSDDT
jgi:hypothetical protein